MGSLVHGKVDVRQAGPAQHQESKHGREHGTVLAAGQQAGRPDNREQKQRQQPRYDDAQLVVEDHIRQGRHDNVCGKAPHDEVDRAVS